MSRYFFFLNVINWPHKYRMECRFLKHGLAISYDHVVKPCCAWKYNKAWTEENHLSKIDLSNWHKSDPIQTSHKILSQDQWPNNCISCRDIESQGRADSMRGNGNHSYQNYKDDDITLEIRPGSVCNFACQTCWPEASSRVAQFYHQAGLADINKLDSHTIENFDFLVAIKHRIKDIIVLGGEPFYDKSCRKFLDWAVGNLTGRITMFTNGSYVDHEFIKSYSNPICLVFSLDAVGRPAEYIRFGTDWNQVLENYQSVKNYDHVELRVNITTSVYNYYYLLDVIEMLCQEWPDCVTYGSPMQPWLNEFSLPTAARQPVINRLERAMGLVNHTEIETGQKHNTLNALQAICNNLQQNRPWDPSATETLRSFVSKMDTVKKIFIKDYCDFLAGAIK